MSRFRAAVVPVLAGLFLAAPLSAEVFEQVLVRVNGDVISKLEFEQRQVSELRNRPELANVTPGSPVLQKAIAETTPDLILSAVDELLLAQRGRELGYALGDDQFNQILGNIKKENNLQTEEQFQAALKQANLTMSELRGNLERQMLIQRVQQVDVMDKISVTEDEAKSYYETHRREFTTQSELMLREIFLEVPQNERGVNVAQDDEIRAKAEETRKRLLAGEPFPRLAADLSSSASKANGGLIGPIAHDQLAADLQKTLDAMKVGDITEVLRTPRGYQILKLESRTEPKVRTFDEARDDISRRVAEQKTRGEMLKYLEKLRAQATIVWRNEELKKAYDAALQKRQQSLDTPAA